MLIIKGHPSKPEGQRELDKARSNARGDKDALREIGRINVTSVEKFQTQVSFLPVSLDRFA
jgi:hypothetical protein